ncbi:MAG: hypothetical protein KGZ25_01635 [Planctomycetes bacterium]|nr:hypothetical protein [Planctomycetota bacterium]
MNSRERVIMSLEGEQPDRIPFDLGSTLVTGMTRGAYSELAKDLGYSEGEPRLYDVVQQLPEMSEAILEDLGVDVRGLIPNMVRKNPQVERHDEYDLFTDEWGLVWKRPEDGLYFDVVSNPLEGEITEEDIEEFPWPDPGDPELMEGLEEKAEYFRRDGRAIILESLCAGVFEMCCRMRSTEQFCMDLVTNPSLAEALMDKFVEQKIAFYRIAAQQLTGSVQFIREGDDIGSQDSLLISPKVYRDLIKPRHARLFEAQRSFFDDPFFVFFHSDGAIRDLIPDFIEIGVGVLNPVQTSAKGMDPFDLKEEFGDKIAFWGGGVDPSLLANGPVSDIQKQAREHIEALSPGGGYIFGGIHNVQDDVSPEHFTAMWEAYEEMREY